MNPMALRFDQRPLLEDRDRSRTRWAMGSSVVLHVALMAWIVWARPAADLREELTEITFVGAGEAEPAGDPAPPPGAEAPRTSRGAEQAAATEEHFSREARPATSEPVPQSDTAVMDRLNARLAAIQNDAAMPLASGAGIGAPRAMWTAAPAAVGPGGGGSAPVALHRGGGVGSAPLSLARGSGSDRTAASAVGVTPATSAAQTPAGSKESDGAARRTLAGASLMGPIADRAIVHHVTPSYPDWAKRDGVEGAVTLHFVVRADGSVKENVLVQKTAGFGELDDNARAALREWRFEPLRAGQTGEQWGVITFHFRLRGA